MLNQNVIEMNEQLSEQEAAGRAQEQMIDAIEQRKIQLMKEGFEELIRKQNQEMMEKATSVTAKMMQAEELFHYWTETESEARDFINADKRPALANNKLPLELLNHYINEELKSKKIAREDYLNALRNMKATNGDSMVQFLFRKSKLCYLIEKHISDLNYVMKDFEKYKQDKKMNPIQDIPAALSTKAEVSTLTSTTEKEAEMFKADKKMLLAGYKYYTARGEATEFRMDESIIMVTPKVDLTKKVISVPKLKS